MNPIPRHPLRIEVYKSANGWRFKFHRVGKSDNPNEQGFSRRIDCIRSLNGIIGCLQQGKYTIVVYAPPRKGAKRQIDTRATNSAEKAIGWVGVVTR